MPRASIETNYEIEVFLNRKWLQDCTKKCLRKNIERYGSLTILKIETEMITDYEEDLYLRI